MFTSISSYNIARIKAFLVLLLFLLVFKYFSFDHYDKISYQMQTTLVADNTFEVLDLRVVMVEEEDDGEHEDEFKINLNDEEFYL